MSDHPLARLKAKLEERARWVLKVDAKAASTHLKVRRLSGEPSLRERRVRYVKELRARRLSDNATRELMVDEQLELWIIADHGLRGDYAPLAKYLLDNSLGLDPDVAEFAADLILKAKKPHRHPVKGKTSTQRRDMKIALHIVARESAVGLTAAKQEAEQKTGASESTVARAWKRYEKAARQASVKE